MGTRRLRFRVPTCMSSSTSLPMGPMTCWYRAGWAPAIIRARSRSTSRTDRVALRCARAIAGATGRARTAMLTLNAISKSFPGVRALSGVNLEVRPGEIHGLVGENGAGKSTLIKIVAGAYAPDEGEMRFADAPVRWSSPREAKLHGVHVVYQEFALFPQLSVAENIFVGQERRNRLGMVNHARTRQEAKELLLK